MAWHTAQREGDSFSPQRKGTKAPRHQGMTCAREPTPLLAAWGATSFQPSSPPWLRRARPRVSLVACAATTARMHKIAVTAVARARLRMPGDWAADRAGRASRCLTGAKAFDEIGGWSALGAISRTGGGWRMAYTHLVGSAAAPRATSPQPSPAQSSRPTRRPSPAEPLLL